MDEAEELARKRFLVLQAVRFAGGAMVVFGVLIIAGRVLDFPELGYVLVVLGAIEFFAMPRILARGWKTPDA